MISRLTLRNFKRCREHRFETCGSVVLAGPNNAGRSTLLQAIATWNLGLDRWAPVMPAAFDVLATRCAVWPRVRAGPGCRGVRRSDRREPLDD